MVFLLGLFIGGALAVRYRERLASKLPPAARAQLAPLLDALDSLMAQLGSLGSRVRRLPIPSTPSFGSPLGRRRRRGARMGARSVLTPSSIGGSSEAMDAPLTLNAYTGHASMGALSLSPITAVAGSGAGSGASSGAATVGMASDGGAAAAAPPTPASQPAVASPSAATSSTSTTRDLSDPAYSARLQRAKSARTTTRAASAATCSSGGCIGSGSLGGAAAVVSAAAATTDVEMELESCAQVQVAVASTGTGEESLTLAAAVEEAAAPTSLAPLVAEHPGGVPTSMIEGMED